MANTNRPQRLTPKMDANIISTLATFSLAKGVSQEELEACIGAPITSLLEEGHRIPENTLTNTWLLLEKRFPDCPLSFELVQATSYASLPAITHGMRYAGNLREALIFLIQHSELLSDRLEMKLIENDHDTYITVNHPVDSLINGHMSEYSALMMQRIVSDIMGEDFHYEKIHFNHSRNTSHCTYEENFYAPVHFLQPHNRLYFIKASLEKKLRQSNVALFSYIKKNFAAKLEKIRHAEHDSPISKLTLAISQNAAVGEFSTQALANRANMSLRAAQRIAASHSKTLKSLVDEERINIAKEALKTGNLDIESISILSGYSDERAFRRAFKRIIHISPAEYRNTFN